MSEPAADVHADACPGMLRPHQAADGLLVRVRVPGGILRRGQLSALAGVAAEFGDGRLELTSRGNVQLRALAAESLDDVEVRLTGAGLLPSASHERVRNIVASPLAGRVSPGFWDVRPVVAELDRRLMAEPTLAALSGRFLFGVDDGSGDVLGLAADLGLFPLGDEVALLVSGKDSLLRVPLVGAADALIVGARAFSAECVAQGVDAWRVDRLVDGPARVRARLSFRAVGEEFRPPLPVDRPVGVVPERDGHVSLGVVVPLGRLSSAQAELLEELGEPTITPWRTVVLGSVDPGLALSWMPALHAAGLPTEPDSAWVGVTACAGRPRCAKALADVHAEATRVVGGGGLPVHWSGCERRCGRPTGDAVDVLATGETRYEVNGRSVEVADLASTVAQARVSTARQVW